MNAKLLATFSSLLILGYAVSFWIDVDVWGTRVIIDDSFKYALTKMRIEGLFLGKEVLFSQGPLAQYLSPLIEDGQTPHVVYCCVALFYLCSLLIAFRVIVRRLEPPGVLNVFLLAVFLIQFPAIFWRQVPDISYYFLTICLVLAASLESEVRRFKVFLILLMLNAVITLQLKLSYGVYAAAVLVLMLICHFRRIGANFVVTSLLGFSALSCVTFRLLTGSWEIQRYFIDGLDHVARFSEIMTFHFPADENGIGYGCGFLLCVDLLAAVCILCCSTVVPRESRTGLVTCMVFSAFVIFKVGYVRYDINHAYPVYILLLETLVLACAILATATRNWYPNRAAVLLMFTIALGSVHIGLGPLKTTLLDSFRTNIQKWQSAPTLLIGGVRLFARGFSQEQDKKNILLSRHPNLFAVLNRLGTSFSLTQPRITFLPWELMFAQCAGSFVFSPIPFLQIYLESCHSDGSAAVEAYLSGSRKPDVIVLGSGAIDERNPVAELTNWLIPLHMKYHLLAQADGYAILRARTGETQAPAVVCDRRPPGLFLRMRAEPLGFGDRLLLALGKIFFKAPTYDVDLALLDGNGLVRRLRWRGYRSQLERGAYSAVMPPGELLAILESGALVRPRHLVAEVLGAELVRRPGIHNLPIGPERSSLEVEYCRPGDFRTP